ncbi:MAG: LysM peptidoglycan-binding domain-containing protein [Chloroflexi bacterium]|nr:LysM peptidoglycan-binding domain-containing protein [Chloroflexota bacterium]
MRGVRDFGSALVVAFLSIGLMLGALSISLVGFIPEEVPTPTQALILSPVPVTATNTLPPTSTLLVTSSLPTSTPTNTFIPPTSCQPPVGWVAVYIQAGDTLENLAARYGTNKDILKSRNCLFTDSLIAGTLLYVPGNVPTSTVAACIQGAAGWVKNYVVKPGDTFYKIASWYGTNANLIKFVNCRWSDIIYPGEILYVPNVPTRTPTFTPLPGITYTSAPFLTEPFTQTVLPFTATFLPTQTPIPPTSTTAPTVTPIPTQTASPTSPTP